MKNFKNWLVVLVLISSTVMFGQGVTTSAINGKIIDSNSEALPGANVVAVHDATGTIYGASTDFDGYFRIANMRSGGPYTITISYVGFKDHKVSNVFLQLGQKFAINHKMIESANALEEVVVRGTSNSLFDGNKNGASTTITSAMVKTIPSVSRGLGDFVRTTPQAQVNGSTISIGGQNNRYNAIYIDGAVNNDVFGLASSGTNGGQTGVSPISVDAIESFQISVAPFDVRQSGFSGGSINAVTRSGTNNIEGSIYGFLRNQNLSGKTPVDLAGDKDREKLDEFTSKTYGVRVGGPIIEDKLFFFINYERQENETPSPFSFDNYIGNSSLTDVQGLKDYLQTTYGYDAGIFGNSISSLESDKFNVKLDWNISKKHKLSLKHSYVSAEQFNAASSYYRGISFSNRSISFPSTTNSTAIELNSSLSDRVSNNLIIGYTTVDDNRSFVGSPFPSVKIKDGAGSIRFGSEPYSTGNYLKQSTLTFTDNLEIYHGAHTITLGTNLEYSKADNLFIRQNFGDYTYDSLEDFYNGAKPDNYSRSYSLLGGIGDDSNGAADFSVFQAGLYAQDDVQVSDNFKVSVGLRIDAPFWEDGLVNKDFNTRTIALLEAEGKDLQGAKVGKGVSTSLHLSPRVGFNWNVKGEYKTQLRGGFGIFTSRMPLVWPGGTYSNNGLVAGGARTSDLPNGGDFIPDFDGQPTPVAVNSGAVGGQVDLFASSFKLPQVFKVNIALDQKLPFWGLIGSGELLYNKNIYAVSYENLNLKGPAGYLKGADNRPYYNRYSSIDKTYRGIFLASNTSEGYSWNGSFTLTKPMTNGFGGSLTYSYGDSYTVFEGTSSQNSSQWRNQISVNGKNSALPASRSQFAQGHRVMVNGSYEFKWNENIKTTFGLFYQGVNGASFSYVYKEGRDLLNDDSRDNALIFVPKKSSDINLVDSSDLTAAEQWTALDAFIKGDDYLNSRRGEYAEINADRAPWNHIVDLKVLQDFSLNIGGKKHTFEASFDIFNFTNLLNKKWGVRKYVANYGKIGLLETIKAGENPEFTFNPSVVENRFDIDDSGIQSSRWQMQVGLRYIFN